MLSVGFLLARNSYYIAPRNGKNGMGYPSGLIST